MISKRKDTPYILFGLLLLSLVAIVGLITIAWAAGVVWNVLLIAGLLLVGLFGLGIVALFLSLKGIIKISWLNNLSQWTNNALFPLALRIGQLFGISREQVRRSYVSINNQIAQLQDVKVPAEDILVLLPHCLQWTGCKVKITNDITNCRRCGKCVIGDLVNLADKYNVHMHVATGGTLARKVVKDVRPQAIVGIACERDLVSGIQDVRGIRVIGVTNERPHGPCCNTTVDLHKLEQALENLIA